MNHPPGFTGERSDHKVAGIFRDRDAARRAAEELRDLLSLQAAQLEILYPGEGGVGRALEPEQAGIFRTILRTHAWLGLAGAVAGLLAFGLMYGLGLALIVQSAGIAALVLTGFGAVAGLMLGGLVSLRPDHDPYISRVRAGLEAGASAVVVHAFDLAQRGAAEDVLQRRGADTIRTL